MTSGLLPRSATTLVYGKKRLPLLLHGLILDAAKEREAPMLVPSNQLDFLRGCDVSTTLDRTQQLIEQTQQLIEQTQRRLEQTQRRLERIGPLYEKQHAMLGRQQTALKAQRFHLDAQRQRLLPP